MPEIKMDWIGLDWIICCQVEIVSSVEELHEYVDKDSLPSSLGGSVNLRQSDWLSYQRVHLASFVIINL